MTVVADVRSLFVVVSATSRGPRAPLSPRTSQPTTITAESPRRKSADWWVRFISFFAYDGPYRATTGLNCGDQATESLAPGLSNMYVDGANGYAGTDS